MSIFKSGASVPQDGKGVLFQNKKTKDTHPDYKGTVMLDGKMYKLAGWIKPTQYGHLVSLSLDTYQSSAERGPIEREVRNDSDVPF
jgi:hypothetical protein